MSGATSNERQQLKVFELLAEQLQEHLRSTVDEETVHKIVDERIAQARLPRPIEIRQGETVVGRLDERPHAQFEQLLELVNEGHRNILMVGPAGCGKTTLAKSLAQALSLDFGFLSLSAGISETHLFGRTLPQADGSWQYKPSRFVEVYVKGGVFLLDEFDAADANVMVAINAALANGVLANPNGQIHERHAKCYVLAAANTWGRGGDHQYVGRNQLDAATLDRFVLSTMHIEYDTDLERDLVAAANLDGKGDELLEWVSGVRERITRSRLRRIASTRLVVNAAAAMKAGRDLSQVKARYFLDWSADEKAKVGE
ncbi:MAG: AAA family ATPase [Planctomycetota bacterium]|nr:AAA family ATPase [Planctomycetota bacterium]